MTEANIRRRRPDWLSEVAAVIAEVDGLTEVRSTCAEGKGILAVPPVGGRGRKRIRTHPEASQALQNWRDMLDGCDVMRTVPAESV